MDTADEEKLIQIRRTVGMVFQNPDNQIVANVVEEDVAFGPENLGVASPAIRQRVDNALKHVGMYDYREHAPHLLSGGQILAHPVSLVKNFFHFFSSFYSVLRFPVALANNSAILPPLPNFVNTFFRYF